MHRKTEEVIMDFEVCRKSETKPVMCIFAIKQDENVIFPLKSIE